MSSGSNVDADAFLTALESKLRGPFSSVDVIKAIPDDASVRLLHSVLSRAQKVTQLRVLTGLSGMEDSNEEDTEIRNIVKTAQTAPEYEEWVRVIAGIVQDIMYDEPGEEATKVLETTCREIIDRVRTVEKESSVVDEDADFLLLQDDIDPSFAPYWQSLVNKPITNDTHHHFVVKEDAEIIHFDDKVEAAKSKEEAVHETSATVRVNATKTTNKTPAADFPGFRSTKTKATANHPKSSLFITSKKPAARPQPGARLKTGSRPQLSKVDPKATLIRKRRPGAAQALLAKGRKGSRVGGSKMKMIDVSESKEKLEEQQQQVGKKRALPPPSSPEATQKKPKAMIESPNRKDWRKILSEHSNKITDAERERVRLFFEEHQNPTPDQTQYRIKLHEEQADENGKTVKVTFYLHLDYTNYTSKQTKKRKEYN